MLERPWSTRSRVYVFGVLLSALWTFAGFVVLFNVLELIIRIRRNPSR